MNGNGIVCDFAKHWRTYLILLGLIGQVFYFIFSMKAHTNDSDAHLDREERTLLENIKNGQGIQSIKDQVDWATWRAEISQKLQMWEKTGMVRTPEQTLELLQKAVDRMLREEQRLRYRSPKKDPKKDSN